MPRNSLYKGEFIRIYASILQEKEFFLLVERGKHDYDTVDQLLGAYVAFLVLLRTTDQAHPGWLYDKDEPLSDRECARRRGIPVSYWAKVMGELMGVKLVMKDKRGAYGVGEDKWNTYQGAVLKRLNYNHRYYEERAKERQTEKKKTGDDYEFPLPPLPPAESGHKDDSEKNEPQPKI